MDKRNPPHRLRCIPASFDVNVFSVMKRSADVNSTKPAKASVSHHLFAAVPLHFSASVLSTCQEKPERLSAAIISRRVLNGPLFLSAWRWRVSLGCHVALLCLAEK